MKPQRQHPNALVPPAIDQVLERFDSRLGNRFNAPLMTAAAVLAMKSSDAEDIKTARELVKTKGPHMLQRIAE